MKKTIKRIHILRAVFFTLFILAGMSVCAHAQDITIVLDGQVIEMESWDVKPFIRDGRVFVPVRAVAEAMKATVEWHPPKTVVIRKDELFITLNIGSDIVHVGHRGSIEMNVTPIVVDGRTMLPIRYVAEALCAEADWDSINDEVIISTDMPGVNDFKSEEWDRKVRILAWCNESISSLYYDEPEEAKEYLFDLYTAANDISGQVTISYGSNCVVNVTEEGYSIFDDETALARNAEITALTILLGYEEYQNQGLRFAMDASLREFFDADDGSETNIEVHGETDKYSYTIKLYDSYDGYFGSYNQRDVYVTRK